MADVKAIILMSLDDAPDHVLGDFTREEWLRRAEKMRQDGDFVRRLLRAAEDAEGEYGTSGSVEEQIYEGFVGRQDERLMASFHTVSWESRVAMIRQFQDVRLKRLARRLVFFERPDLLADADRDLMAAELRRRRLAINAAISLGGACIRDFGRRALLAALSTSRGRQGAVPRKRPLISGHRSSTLPRDFGPTLRSHCSEPAPGLWLDGGRLTGHPSSFPC